MEKDLKVIEPMRVVTREEWLTPPPGVEGLPDYFIDLCNMVDTEPEYSLYFKGKGCFPRGDIQVITGIAKEGKTTFARVLMAAMLNGDYCGFYTKEHKPLRVMIIDTEQGRRNVNANSTELMRIAKVEPAFVNHRYLQVLFLRPQGWKERRRVVRKWIRRMKPDFALLDGAVDLTKSANDEDSVSELRDMLLELSANYDSAITTIIHLNKTLGANGEREMRGHLGTELANKVSEVYEVKKDKAGGYSVVRQKLWRNEQLPEFELHIDCDADGKNVYSILSGGEIADREHERVLRVLRDASKAIAENKIKPNVANWLSMVCEIQGITNKTANDNFIKPARACGLLRVEPDPDRSNGKLLFLSDAGAFDDLPAEDTPGEPAVPTQPAQPAETDPGEPAEEMENI